MADPSIDIVCLCAAWCRLCDDYAPAFAKVLDELEATGPALRRHWIDIEDEAELVGDLDVETFPTLVVIGSGGVVRFAGPLTPQPDTLRRVLRACVVDAPAGASATEVPPQVQAFAARLRARTDCA
jgi:thioredoxin 1